MINLHGFNFQKVNEAEYKMEKTYKGASVHIFAEDNLLKQMDKEVFKQALNVALLPGLVGNVCIMPDAHSGYGAPIGTVFAMNDKDGFISPGAVGYDINCGMRLLKTDLFLKDIKPYLEKIVNMLFDYVPAGIGKKGFIKVSKQELKQLVEEGIFYLDKKGLTYEKDKNYIENKGKINGADFSNVSNEAIERGLHQVATLGSGNHYLEIQKVEKIFDQKKAAELGILKENQIMIMVHCGSRGFGHQICTDYLKIFNKHTSEFKLHFNDSQLVSAPINSSHAKNYYSAMAAACNFAYVNREAITYQIRKVFTKIMGLSNNQLPLIYDVSHNIAQFEEHESCLSADRIAPQKKARLLIHRKGATRSYPNQPVIIGGSMETGSYLLIGTDKALKKSFGSTAHGSGRTMSRSKARKLIQSARLLNNMREKGIYVKTSSFSSLAEEAGFAYKNISDVVKSVDLAGLSKPVAYFKPIGNIKG